jgi:hypothetical protein
MIKYALTTERNGDLYSIKSFNVIIKGDCWGYDEAKVFEYGKIFGNTVLCSLCMS